MKYVLGLSLLAAMVAGGAMAASSGQVTITGSVPAACNITVTTTAGATIANLALGATDRTVATVQEACNDPDGYRVTMVGANSGTYTGRFIDSVSGDFHPFTIKYNGGGVVSNLVTDVNAPDDTTKNVDITYAADAGLTATSGATYAETLTFAITAK